MVGEDILINAQTFIDQGFSPLGVNQYPNQSVSWTAHSHLDGLIVNHLSVNDIK